MKKQELVSIVQGPTIRPLRLIQFVFLTMFFSSVFVWIWDSWELAWKMALTGFIGTMLMHGLIKIAKEAVEEIVDEALEEMKESTAKSSFKERMAQKEAEKLYEQSNK